MISLLIASRKNDKFLSKILMSIMTKTYDLNNIEVLVMCSAQDEWNKDLIKFYKGVLTGLYFGQDEFIPGASEVLNIKFFFEDYHYGNRGLHVYFNELAEKATGDYLWYLCSDHDIILQDYDKFILDYIEKEKQLSPDKIWGIVPGMRDVGPVSHIISRATYETLGHIALSDKIDSWYNDILYRIPQDRLFTISGTQMMTDYTPKYGYILSSDHSKIEGQIDPPDHIQNGSARYHEVIDQEAQKLREAIQNGK
jgi:hypothetical protein